MSDSDYPKHIAYSVGILKPSTHYKMVSNLKMVAERAGIPQESIYTSISEVLSTHEISLMKEQHKLFKEGHKGLMYVGEFEESILDHMSSITGMFIRNFHTAKLRMMHEILPSLKSGDYDYLNCKCLAIPDFFTVGTGAGKKLFDNDIAMLMSFLYRRANSKELTFIHIENMDKFQQSFGRAFTQFVNAYKLIEPEDIKDI